MISTANRLLVVGVWIVAVLTAGVLLVIFGFVYSLIAGVIAGALALVLLIWLPVVLPRRVNPQPQDATR